MISITSVNGALAGIPPNISRTWNISSVSGYGAMIQDRFSTLLSMTPDGRLYGRWFDAEDQTLDITSGKYVFGYKDELNSARWRHVEDVGEISIYENIRAMPRAWLVYEVRNESPSNIQKAIKSSVLPDGQKFLASKTALVEEPFDLKMNSETEGTTRILRQTDGSVTIYTKSKVPAFLVLSDTYYPGWVASVDKKPVHIYRTNYVQRGILVPEGKHVVRFDYKPGTLYLGAIFSTAGALFLSWIMLSHRHRGSPRQKDAGWRVQKEVRAGIS